MTLRHVSTIRPAPSGFAEGDLTKKTLLASPLVLLTRDIEAVFRVVPGGRERIEGVLVVPGARQERVRLGALLWAITVPEELLSNLQPVLATTLEAVEAAVELRERMTEASRLADRAQHDLQVTRRDYNEVSSKLLEDLERSRAIAEENARLFAEAQAALQAREEFLSIASHELRTPLTPLKLRLQSLRRLLSKSSDPKVEPLIVKANDDVERLTRLVETLLDADAVGRGELTLQREPVDLVFLVTALLEQFKPTIERSGCAVTLSGEGALVGEWDRLRLEQVIINLLSNALKFGAGKPVEIRVEALPGPSARLVVTDHGIGIDPARQERLFERFERAVSPREFGGLGLGLYLTRKIVEAHGGSIGLESQPGAGTSVGVVLPLALGDACAA